MTGEQRLALAFEMAEMAHQLSAAGQEHRAQELGVRAALDDVRRTLD
jgi:hypothetical protein